MFLVITPHHTTPIEPVPHLDEDTYDPEVAPPMIFVLISALFELPVMFELSVVLLHDLISSQIKIDSVLESSGTTGRALRVREATKCRTVELMLGVVLGLRDDDTRALARPYGRWYETAIEPKTTVVTAILNRSRFANDVQPNQLPESRTLKKSK